MQRYIVLENTVLIHVSGADAERYMNSRLTTNVKALVPLSGMPTAAVDAKGRIDGVYWIGRLQGDAGYLIHATESTTESVLSVLSKFKVADRIDFTPLATRFCTIHLASEHPPGALGTPIPERGSFVISADSYVISRRRCAEYGYDLLIPEAKLDSHLKNLEALGYSPMSKDLFRFLRVVQNIPSFPEELSPGTNLLESGGEKLFSVNKGCYVGQEVIEKVESYGRLAYVIGRCFFSGKAKVSAGSEVRAAESGETLGTVLSHGYSDEREQTAAFVRVKQKSLHHGMKINADENAGELLLT